ncbi:hypothetical protein HMPREF0494_1228 [Limosilactobacillus antri DSM 16041]|uniref:Uncharacterized protein n=1 Tax=Limosilactobacillus antri DSM 16041 TaxID=525309 RepID=C8P7D4_9LACO|nr:hypothetical protein HMPREF0494_1228 [Limosilactobacillus antri DSM 16041]
MFVFRREASLWEPPQGWLRRAASLFGVGQTLVYQRLNCQPATALRHFYLKNSKETELISRFHS